MKKALKFLALLALCLLLCVSLIACGNSANKNGGDNTPPVRDGGSNGSDGSNGSSGSGNESGDSHAHTPSDAVKEIILNSTCTREGWYYEVLYCSSCNEEISRTITTTPIIQHEYMDDFCLHCGSPSPSEGLEFMWVDGGYEVSGIGTCKDADIIIPNQYNGKLVISIGEGAFYERATITSITMLEGITNINRDAFENCYSLTNINFPDSVNSIGPYAFSGCVSLKNLTIGNGVTKINSYAFYNCSSLENINIPDSVTFIASCAFSNCSSLASVTFGNGVSSIGKYSFSDCYSLTSVTFSNAISSIDTGAFSSCSLLTSVYITDVATWCNIDFANYNSNPLYYAKNLYLNGELISNLLIPESVTKIPLYAFSCQHITSVTIGNDVISIGESAFSDCSSLSSVTIGNGVISIGESAFSDCSSLSSVTIGNAVSSIGNGAFSNCSSLTGVTIPNSVTSIGKYAFSDCFSLVSATIPNSVTSIGHEAFGNCSSLTSINYSGTMLVWNTIDKDSFWDYNTGNYTIYCKDGNIEK